MPFESGAEEEVCGLVWFGCLKTSFEGVLNEKMAVRWSSNLRQGLRFIGNLSNVRKFLRFEFQELSVDYDAETQ